MEDWTLGSLGCYDAPSLARLQSKLELDFKGLAEGNVAGCVSVALRPEVRPQFLPCTSGLTGGSAVCIGLLLFQSVRLSRGRCRQEPSKGSVWVIVDEAVAALVVSRAGPYV